MKTFFRTVKDSFGNSTLYAKVKDETAWKGIGFLSKCALLLGVFFGIIGIVAFLACMPAIKNRLIPAIKRAYPEGVVLTVQDGVLTTNVPEPVLVPVPEVWRSAAVKNENEKTNLIAVAPNEAADPVVLEKYDSVIVLTKTAIVAGNDEGQVRVQSYRDMDGTLTKEKFSGEILGTGLKALRAVALIGTIPMAVILVFFFTFLHLVWLFVVALFVWLMFSIRKIPITYKQSYRMGIYALVPLLVIEIIAVPLHFTGRLLSAAVVIGVIWLASRNWGKPEKVEDIIVQPPELNP